MNWTELTIRTTKDGIEPLCGLLMSLNVTSFIVEDPQELTAFAEENADMWDIIGDEVYASFADEPNIKIYIEDNPEGKKMFSDIAAGILTMKNNDSENLYGSLTLSLSELPDNDWENAWKAFFKPFTVGKRLAVCPSWEKFENPEGRIVLSIDPGSSFGSGQHETTRLCLSELEKYVGKDERVLDIGCGSGILSVAAARLGAASVLGIDIDPHAVETSVSCAAENNVTDSCSFVCGDLAERAEGGYGVIVGNLFAGLIIRLLPDISRVAAPGAIVILSGIIADSLQSVLDAVSDNSLTLVDTQKIGQWYAITAKLSM